MIFLDAAISLFTGNDPVSLAEWFVASIGILVIVTFVYVFVLNKSPPPEGITVAKLEQQQAQIAEHNDSREILEQVHTAMLSLDYAKVVNVAVRSSTLTLLNILRSNGTNPSDMNVSDLAYLIQSKARSCPEISQPLYQLNILRLKAAQGQPITQQEAEWSISIANWLAQIAESGQISF